MLLIDLFYREKKKKKNAEKDKLLEIIFPI